MRRRLVGFRLRGAPYQVRANPRPTLECVIQMWLRLTPQSTTTLQALCGIALPAVVNELRNAGYTVEEPAKHPTGGGWAYTAAIQPGPAKISADAKWGGDLNIRLSGISFGHSGRYLDVYNLVLWDRLELLRQQLVAAHSLSSPRLGDPGPLTGELGAAGA